MGVNMATKKHLTWKQVKSKYSNEIFLRIQRLPFWKWANRHIPEFEILDTSYEIRENYMTVHEWASFYAKQGLGTYED